MLQLPHALVSRGGVARPTWSGYKKYSGFKNQGDCVSYVATKGKNKPAGS